MVDVGAVNTYQAQGIIDSCKGLLDKYTILDVVMSTLGGLQAATIGEYQVVMLQVDGVGYFQVRKHGRLNLAMIGIVPVSEIGERSKLTLEEQSFEALKIAVRKYYGPRARN